MNRSISLFMFTLMAVMAFFVSVPHVSAQTFSGQGVDMRALQGGQHSCKRPAMNIKTDFIRLSITIKQILECNERGGFYRQDGSCDLVVSPGHQFLPGRGGEPTNEDALAFITGGGEALIGGPDGEDVICELNDPCDINPNLPGCGGGGGGCTSFYGSYSDCMASETCGFCAMTDSGGGCCLCSPLKGQACCAHPRGCDPKTGMGTYNCEGACIGSIERIECLQIDPPECGNCGGAYVPRGNRCVAECIEPCSVGGVD